MQITMLAELRSHAVFDRRYLQYRMARHCDAALVIVLLFGQLCGCCLGKSFVVLLLFIKQDWDLHSLVATHCIK